MKAKDKRQAILAIGAAAGITLAASLAFGGSRKRREKDRKNRELRITGRKAQPDPGLAYNPSDNRTHWERFPDIDREAEIDILASVITSEDASGTAPERRAIGWVMRNKAENFDRPLVAFLSPGKKQTEQAQASTREKGSARDRKLAEAILDSPQNYDPTRGSHMFFEPMVQWRLWRRKPYKKGKGGTRHPAEIRQKWPRDYGVSHRATVGGWEFYG